MLEAADDPPPAATEALGLARNVIILVPAGFGSAAACADFGTRLRPRLDRHAIEFLRLLLIALARRWLYHEPHRLAIFPAAALTVAGTPNNMHGTQFGVAV